MILAMVYLLLVLVFFILGRYQERQYPLAPARFNEFESLFHAAITPFQMVLVGIIYAFFGVFYVFSGGTKLWEDYR